MRAIRREQDFSQAILLSAWPFPLWLILATAWLAIRLFWRPGLLNQSVKTIFLFYSLFAILYSLYLAYWLFFYYRISRKWRKV